MCAYAGARVTSPASGSRYRLRGPPLRLQGGVHCPEAMCVPHLLLCFCQPAVQPRDVAATHLGTSHIHGLHMLGCCPSSAALRLRSRYRVQWAGHLAERWPAALRRALGQPGAYLRLATLGQSRLLMCPCLHAAVCEQYPTDAVQAALVDQIIGGVADLSGGFAKIFFGPGTDEEKVRARQLACPRNRNPPAASHSTPAPLLLTRVFEPPGCQGCRVRR